ncbi:MAG TPA: glycoside hydrolase family 16 protein [Bacteroidales bacterium]|nr:glycoside hydrolase family 16 protein [Bacteroidales bacterium]
MKKALFLLIIALSLGVTELQAQNWSIFREYEFNSSPIDTNIWVNYYPTGHYWWCNVNYWYFISRCHGTPITELATYWNDYAQYFNNGTNEGVKLVADESYHKFENCVYYNYKSGMIFSKEYFQYGKFEIKRKVPIGQGLHPAFWLWGGGGEIDVLEFMNEWSAEMKKVSFNYHNINDGFSDGTTYLNTINYSNDYHIYSIEWSANHIKWYVDNVLRWMVNSNAEGFPGGQMRIIANLAIQGTIGSHYYGPNTSTPFPSEFDIEYIKVYHSICPSYVLCDNDNLTTYSGYDIDLAVPNDVDYNGVVEDLWNHDDLHDLTCPKTVTTNLTVNAEHCITLNAGFSVELGAEFDANIINCSK